MPSTHRNYDKDFRQEAVNLLLSSGRPLKRVAAELGVTANSLRTWRDRALGKGGVAQAASAEPKGRSEAPLADLGWKLSDSLHADLVVDATRRAIDSGLVARGAIFHSDRGCQYSATVTRELLARHGLRQSMSAKGHCYDNAFSEAPGSFVRSLRIFLARASLISLCRGTGCDRPVLGLW